VVKKAEGTRSQVVASAFRRKKELMRVISGSLWRKLMALVVAVTGFVFLYETRSMDSTGLQALLGDV
jgi:hypothetical protein